MTPPVEDNTRCSLPVKPLPDDIDTESLLQKFVSLASSPDIANFTSDAVWRDICAFTGTFRTFYGADSIVHTWRALATNGQPTDFKYQENSARVVQVEDAKWLEGIFSFNLNASPARTCTGIVSIAPKGDQNWQIWMIRTFIDRLVGHPSVDEYAPLSQQNADTKLALVRQQTCQDFECVVVGAGQAGLSIAGRLQSQGVKYLVLEKNDAVGDNWANRYDSTKLHTTRESSHLPFDRTFPSYYPQFLTKNDLARGYSEWTRKFGINVWSSTTLVAGKWNFSNKTWTLQLLKAGQRATITAKHLVMCIGAGCQVPATPDYPGKEQYRGDIRHSVEYISAAEWKGKRGVVIGTANTAHDIAEDMVAATMSTVTMVQRSPTYVLPAEYYSQIQDKSYNAEIPIETADLALTTPTEVSRIISKRVLHAKAQAEPERFDALERAGFKTIRYGDIIYQVYERFGGHYLDVGASAKIAKGLIKVKSDAVPVHYTQDGLMFNDGEEVKTEVVVFATGFIGGMKQAIHDLLGSEIADRVEEFWGLDKESEIQGLCRPTGHSNLWMHGGTCSHARYMARFLALQIRASLDGTPLQPYTRQSPP